MIDTDKEFQKAMSDLGIASNYLGDGQYGGIYGKTCYKLWQACQQINDKRIADLLALVAKKDALIRQCIEENGYLADGDNCTLKPIIDAIALTVRDVELVEVKDYHDMICGAGSLYTIKEKP